MNPAGILIAIAGAWIVSQVFAGNALERMNILKPAPTGGGGGPGLPDVTPYVPGGPKNPPSIDFGDLFPKGFGGGGTWL